MTMPAISPFDSFDELLLFLAVVGIAVGELVGLTSTTVGTSTTADAKSVI